MVYDLDELTAVPSALLTTLPPVPDAEPVAEVPIRHSRYWRSFRLRLLIALVLCGVILTIPAWWPQGAEYLRQQANSGEVSAAQTAAQTLVTEILSGENIPEAIAAFCQEVADAQN